MLIWPRNIIGERPAKYQIAEENCQNLDKELKRHIVKSESYYEEKARWNIQMECQKARIEELEQTLCLTKTAYKEAMLNLSKISEEVS
jgi:hypothetical protein